MNKHWVLAGLTCLLTMPTFALDPNYCQQNTITNTTIQGYVNSLCQSGASMQNALKAADPTNNGQNANTASQIALGNPIQPPSAPVVVTPPPASAQQTTTNPAPQPTPAVNNNRPSIYSHS